MIRFVEHRVAGASIETTLELWASSLRDAKRRMHPLFTQDRVARSTEDFLDGLLGEARRKTGGMRAEAAGDPGPRRQQAILGRGSWDAHALRDYALETLADDNAVLVIDETGFLKQGKASHGNTRARQEASRTARSACSLAMFRVAAIPSSTASSICRRAGRTTKRVWRKRMFRRN